MREKFKSIPFPLQKQIISRFAAGLLFVFLFLVILFCFWDVYLFLPCVFFAVFLIVNAILLFYNSYKGDTFDTLSETGCFDMLTDAFNAHVITLVTIIEQQNRIYN